MRTTQDGASAWTLGLVALLATSLVSTTRAEEPKTVAPWRDEALVLRRFAEACDAVEAICGAKFEMRPSVRIADAETLRTAARRNLTESAKVLELDDDALDGLAELLSKIAVGLYDANDHTVLVGVEAAETLGAWLRLDPPLGEDELRVVLAHEATHALDHERSSLYDVAEDATADSLQAAGAVAEGHAQHVAREAALRWKIAPAFDRVTRLITEMPEGLPADLSSRLAPLHAEMAFSYVQGLAFVDAVAKARGAEGIAAALLQPPRSTRSIERPAEWLAGGERAATEPDLDVVLSLLRPLAGDPAWSVQTQRILEAVARAAFQGHVLPGDPDPAEGFLDGRVLVASVDGEDAALLAAVFLYERPEQARALTDVQIRGARQSSKGRTAVKTVEERSGGGADDHLPGAWASYLVGDGDEAAPLTSHVVAVGRVAISLTVAAAPAVDRAVQDAALARVEEYVGDPTKVPEPPAVVPYVRRNALLTIRVTDPGGAPVASATARLYEDDHEVEVPVEDGKAETWRKPRAMEVAVWGASDAEGNPLRLAPRWGIEVAPEATTLDVALEAGKTIDGRVLDSGGEPVVGASVQAQASDGRTFGRAAGAVHGTGTTDGGGRFRIVGVAAASYGLQVERHRIRLAHDVREARGGDTGIEIRLAETKAVRLVVLGPDGKGVAFAQVHLSADVPSAGFHSQRTGRDGSATFPAVDAGASWALAVTPPPTARDLGILYDDGWSPSQTEVRLPRGFTVRGVVRDTHGNPTAATVRWQRGKGSWTSHATSPDGTFELRHMPYGPVSIAAAARDWRPWTDEAVDWVEVTPESGEVELHLRAPAATTTVTVLDGEGKPVPRAQVAITIGSTTHYREATDGSATFARPASRYAIQAFRAESEDGTALGLGPAQREDLDPAAGDVELRLPPGKRIRGRVRSEAGVGVAGAAIAASPSRGGSHHDSHALAVSQEDGSFELVGLGPGPQFIAVEAPAPFAPPPDTTAEAGAEDVEIVLYQGLHATLQVLDSTSKPVAGAKVTIFKTVRHSDFSWTTHHMPGGATDDSGRVKLGPFLATDDLSFRVDPPQRRSDLAPRRVDAWRVADTQLTLERGFTVHGRVEDGGSAVARARVSWRTGTNPSQEVEADSQGRFDVPGVPHGPVLLRAARAEEREEADHEWTTATPESSGDVVLRVPPRRKAYRVLATGVPKGHRGSFQAEGSAEIQSFEFQQDGVATLDTRPGTYAIWVPTFDGSERCAFRSDARFGDLNEVTMDLRPAQVIRFRVKVPEGSVVHQADVLGPLGIPFEGYRMTDGSYEVRGLPEGRWKVKAKARSPDAWLYALDEVPTGETVVEVEPKPK